jgi:hypothetical protein
MEIFRTLFLWVNGIRSNEKPTDFVRINGSSIVCHVFRNCGRGHKFLKFLGDPKFHVGCERLVYVVVDRNRGGRNLVP